jgi:hypothetical protein
MERAIELSHALLRIARRDPYFVRLAVLGYCCAVSDRRRIILTDMRVVEYGQIIIGLVKELKLPWLEIRLVGYMVGDEKGHMKKWLEILKPGPTTQIDYVQAENQSSQAELEHIGIDIRNTVSKRNSLEFLEVMVIAASAEMWRCVWPQKRAVRRPDTQMIFGFSLSPEELH